MLIMNFCSIDEAWGNNHQTFISKNFKDSTDEECISSSSIGSIEITKKGSKRNHKINYTDTATSNSRNSKLGSNLSETDDSYLIETFTESVKDKKNCNKLVNHILKCKKCRNKLRNKFRPPLVKKINNLFDDNKDVGVLILIAFAIVIFFKLIYSMC
jgi:hypothetical protein